MSHERDSLQESTEVNDKKQRLDCPLCAQGQGPGSVANTDALGIFSEQRNVPVVKQATLSPK